VDLADIAKLLAADLAALAAIAAVWAFVAKDGASARTRVSVLAVIGSVILVVGLIVWPRSEAEPTGEIVSPASGDEVGRGIEVRGVLADIPEDEHVRLLVRDENLLHAHEPEVTPVDGLWSLSIQQEGESESISLELYLVSDEGNRYIDKRFGPEGGPGISRIPGAERLHAVENLRIRD
jgi:hypothetical protein